jgi:hypothetical protein
MSTAAPRNSEELASQTTYRHLGPAARAIYDLISQSTGDLGGVARHIWRAGADGRIADGEADYLRGLIERRRTDARRTTHIDAAAKPTIISKFEIFIARAWARATLFAAGEMTLHNAVDELQQYAVVSGLVAELGQDEIQHVMSAAFANVHRDIWITASDPDRVEIEPIREQPCAAASTVEAVVYALRTNGTAAIAANRERLIEVSATQLEDVIVRLSAARQRYSSITDHLLELLAELLP